ncbi:MAG: PhnD/SsuA/transferrin family substrate-binding protein [Alphaproteobacteria bacterium]|nr:PhnD/SsuA/transferrin family substrate-binding protein [Alphaproteobacteria bacterium]MCB9792043.1 PhnD/SsuA/transferrin family substrate-binding protein [Alphaproteobacteria bacterium]
MTHSITLGAVAYDPKVVTIWEGFKAWFADQGVAFDFVLYSNYERQVQGHFRGEFDVAWNSPLAWLQTRRVAEAVGREASGFTMRDSDCDLTSLVVVRGEDPAQSLEDLRGRVVGVGAPDSPQATLIPLMLLQQAGLTPGEDFEVRVFDVLFGKHGDHVGGERLAAKALMAGEVDAACMIDGNHLAFSAEGTLPAKASRVLAATAPYDHCIFTALDGVDAAALERFTALLLGQRYEDPVVRPLLDLEGLKQWKPGRTFGFAQLDAAISELHFEGAEEVRRFIAALIAEQRG